MDTELPYPAAQLVFTHRVHKPYNQLLLAQDDAWYIAPARLCSMSSEVGKGHKDRRRPTVLVSKVVG